MDGGAPSIHRGSDPDVPGKSGVAVTARGFVVDGRAEAVGCGDPVFGTIAVTNGRILPMVLVGMPTFARSSTDAYGRPAMIFFAIAAVMFGRRLSAAADAVFKSTGPFSPFLATRVRSDPVAGGETVCAPGAAAEAQAMSVIKPSRLFHPHMIGLQTPVFPGAGELNKKLPALWIDIVSVVAGMCCRTRAMGLRPLTRRNRIQLSHSREAARLFGRAKCPPLGIGVHRLTL
ncbi:MAG TPA: hypothetical protein VGZ27_01660 [Vicinamibacterales bacterium]|jgi:hypothetical protein|nr:hypothetical protein [Vicinamibacterales bacterium]